MHVSNVLLVEKRGGGWWKSKTQSEELEMELNWNIILTHLSIHPAILLLPPPRNYHHSLQFGANPHHQQISRAEPNWKKCFEFVI